jgi:hypothetical protein
MKTFETPEPIALEIEMVVGDLEIIASERPDTVVDVEPTNPGSEADVNAAEQTQVELVGRHLVIKTPKGWKQWTPWGGRESVNVRVELPAGSDLRAATSVASLRASGRLGHCVYRTSIGDAQVDEVRSLEVKTSSGQVVVGSVGADATVVTSSGHVRVAQVGGAADIKSSNGDVSLGTVGGDVHAVTSNGRISIDDAGAGVSARTANGDIRLGTVRRGTAEAQTSLGRVEIGVAEGVTAWLDLDTNFGTVRNDLDTAEQPAPGAPTVEIRARSSFGTIAVHRSAAPAPEPTRR